MFNGNNYAFQIIKMWAYLISLAYDVQHSIVCGYIEPKTPPTKNEAKKAYNHNGKATNVILSGLSQKYLVKSNAL